MQSGISIMDLGLNEFRLDLLEYVKNNGDMDKVPFGLHAVVPASRIVRPGNCVRFEEPQQQREHRYAEPPPPVLHGVHRNGR